MSSNQRGSVVFLYIAAIFAICEVAVLSTLIYDNSSAGIVFLLAEFVGAAILPVPPGMWLEFGVARSLVT